MPIHLDEITNEILRVHYSSQEHLASTFLRFQEHYESPEFRGKIFTLEEYQEYYTKKHGEFSYYKDWSGFNIPSYVLEPFRGGKFDPLSPKESLLLDLLRTYEGKFYVIGTYERNDDKQKEEITLQHEIAHGLFYTVQEYKDEILAVLSKADIDPIRKYVKDFGEYADDVLDDEVQAVLISRKKEFPIDGFKEKYANIKKELEGIYDKYLTPRLKNRPRSSVFF